MSKKLKKYLLDHLNRYGNVALGKECNSYTKANNIKKELKELGYEVVVCEHTSLLPGKNGKFSKVEKTYTLECANR